MERPELLAAGTEPRRARPALSAALRRRFVHVGLVAVTAALAALVVASWWSGRATTAPRLSVSVDRSEYFLPHPPDSQGHAQVMLLLSVAGADAAGDDVAVAGLTGGGVSATGPYPLPATRPARVVVRATLGCAGWAGGQGVRALFRVVGPSGPTTTEAVLDLGPGTHLHAQLDEACARWRALDAPGAVLLVGADQGHPERAAQLLTVLSRRAGQFAPR